MPESIRKLAAILAADVAAYSRHMAMDESRTLAALWLLRDDTLGPSVKKHRGEIIKSMGDGWLIEFMSVVDAVGCAIQVQRQLAVNKLIQLRIGIHVGDVVHETQDIFGDGVNIAARLQQLSQPGGIIISDITHRSMDDILGSEFVNLGARSLKNIPSAMLVFGWRGGVQNLDSGSQKTSTGDWADRQALIVALAKTGDREAFTELVKQHQSWIRNLMRRACGDPALADDLAQQAFMQAWQKIHNLRHPHRFNGWLRRLAINTWLQHLRKNDVLHDPETIDDTPAPEFTGDTAIDLDRALSLLSKPARLCIVLSYHEGMTHEEIAEYVDFPVGTVKSHIYRGTKRLQEFLTDYRSTTGREKTDEC